MYWQRLSGYLIGGITSVPVEVLFVMLVLFVPFTIMITKVSSRLGKLAVSKHFTIILLKLIGLYWSAQTVRENIKSEYEKRTLKLISVTNVVQGRTNNGSI